jgi:hypothetical protein
VTGGPGEKRWGDERIGRGKAGLLFIVRILSEGIEVTGGIE